MKREISNQYHEGVSDPSRVVAKMERRYHMRKNNVNRPKNFHAGKGIKVFETQ